MIFGWKNLYPNGPSKRAAEAQRSEATCPKSLWEPKRAYKAECHGLRQLNAELYETVPLLLSTAWKSFLWYHYDDLFCCASNKRKKRGEWSTSSVWIAAILQGERSEFPFPSAIRTDMGLTGQYMVKKSLRVPVLKTVCALVGVFASEIISSPLFIILKLDKRKCRRGKKISLQCEMNVLVWAPGCSRE